MEKKPMNRNVQLQSRTSGDCKKLLDTNLKPFTRQNRKRESVNDSRTKNDSQKKNSIHARVKGQGDRRGKTKYQDDCLSFGSESTRLEEDDQPELGSVFSPGSKKQNLNHLLNFMYSPRERVRTLESTQPLRKSSNVARTANRDMFLQANCQFVVNTNGNYRRQLDDPDLPVPWDLIHQVVVHTEGCGFCPVCLHEPVAARATRCGHVYCAPCILHYLALADVNNPPCPVCHYPIAADQLKSACVEVRSRSDVVTLVRVKRRRGTAVVIVDEGTEPEDVLPELSNKIYPFARLITATQQQVLDIYARERKELQNQIMNEIDTSEIVYIEQALENLKQQEYIMQNLPEYRNEEIIKETLPNVIVEKSESALTKYDWFDGEGVEEKIVEQLEDLDLNSDLNPEAEEFKIEAPVKEQEVTEDRAKYFYFYQAADGSPMFLHSVNVRLLQASWGNLSEAPQRLTARVLHRAAHTVNDQTRSRAPYTAHLPLHTPYEVLELELRPPNVTQEALESFKEELDKRSKARRAVKRREKQSEKKAYNNGNKMAADMYGYGGGNVAPDTHSDLHFPQALAPSVQIENSAPVAQARGSAAAAAGPSFAHMASSSGVWRVRTVSSSCTSVRPATSNEPAIPAEESEEQRAAPVALSLSDAIAAALSAPRPAKKKRGKK